MTYLLLRILFNTTFSQLLRLAQVRDGQMLPAALVNYGVAALLGGIGFFLLKAPPPHPVSLLLGAATGVTYAVSLLGLEAAMHTSGISIAVAVLQLAVLVPTVASILFFHERPDAWQVVGIVAAIIALPLLSRSRALPDSARLAGRDVFVIVFLLFFVTGCSGVLMKAFQQYAPPGDRLAYTVALFTVSALVIGLAVAARRIPWGPSAWPLGGLVGAANLAQLEVTLLALAALPAAVVFPATAVLTVVLNTLLAVRFWGEVLEARALLGMALAILAAVLLNL